MKLLRRFAVVGFDQDFVKLLDSRIMVIINPAVPAMHLPCDSQQRKMLQIVIPPYSPDLNPIEQVWKLTRREVTHNRYFPNNETLAACLNDYFKQFEHHTEKMVNLCTFNFEKKNRKLKRFIRVGTFYAMKKVKEKCQTAIILWQENVPSSHLERLLTMVLP